MALLADLPAELRQQILQLISDYNLNEEGGYAVIESLKEDEFREDYEHLACERDRVYGISRITYYRGK